LFLIVIAFKSPVNMLPYCLPFFGGGSMQQMLIVTFVFW